MALSTTTVGGTPVPGLLTSIGGSQPVGQQTVSPTQNISAPPNTTSTPATIDLSSKYANVGGIIYNTQTNQKFSNRIDFFKDSGVTSFNNLKFNTNYTPKGTETIYGQQPVQPVQPVNPPAQNPPVSSNSAPTGLLPNLANSTPTNTGTPTSSFYSPPNQGTTGVSQGGIIGNLNTNALNNPNYQAAVDTYNKDKAALTALDTEMGTQNNEILSRPEGLSQQTGQQGMLQNLYATKRAALASQLSADTALLGAANTSQANTTSGLSAAGGLNAPITNPQTGGLVSPSANTTTNATTSGAANLNSLIGQRMGADGKTTEFFNTQTGQGFSTPDALAQFVNQQMPGIGANAQNVFGLLQSQNSGQPVPPNNPYYQTLQGFAQQMANGQMAAVPYSGLPPVIQQQLLQMAKAINPSFDFNTATAQGAAQQNIVSNQTNQAAAWKSAQQQSQALTGQLQPLLSQINPSQLTFVNGVIQTTANLMGNPTYQQAANLLTEIANTYANVLNPAGGTLTDTVRNTATGMINGLASGQSISQVIAGLDAQAQAKISAIPTQTNLSGLTSAGGTIPTGSLTITTP